MRSKSFWLSVAAALALAAPMAADRSDQDPGTSPQQYEPDSMAGRFADDQPATSGPQAPEMVQASATQAEPLPSANAQPVTGTEPQAPPTAPAPVQQEETAPSAPAVAAAPAPDAAAPAELPKTASPLALLTLLGLGSAGSATGLRFFRRR